MTAPSRSPELTRSLILLMATGSGLAAANNYYLQPLLHTVSRDFSVSTATAGLTSALGQFGYVLGLGLIVPLGDLMNRRRLITRVTALSGVGLLGVAAAPNIALLMVFTLATGVCTVAAQIFVPFAAFLASDRSRGRAVGAVMSGLLIGILLARTVAGLVAEVAGWRSVFLLAALMTFALSAACHRLLPSVEPATRTSYGQLLRSVPRLWTSEPVLRRRSLYGALTYGCFAVLWTAISFELSDDYHYSEAVIGLFGLLGVAGALCAQVAGRIADAGWARVATVVFLVLLALSWAALYAGRASLALLVIGVVVLDIGVQGTHLSNQSEIYRLAAEARSRVTTVYMCGYFLGGVTGSALSAVAYQTAGWGGVCALGAVGAVAAVVLWTTELRLPLRRMRHRPAEGHAPS